MLIGAKQKRGKIKRRPVLIAAQGTPTNSERKAGAVDMVERAGRGRGGHFIAA